MSIFTKLIIERLQAVLQDDLDQIETIKMLDHLDTEDQQKENLQAIEYLTKRSERTKRIIEIVTSKGISDLQSFRQLFLKKYFDKGQLATTSNFHLRLHDLIIVIDTIIKLGYNNVSKIE